MSEVTGDGRFFLRRVAFSLVAVATLSVVVSCGGAEENSRAEPREMRRGEPPRELVRTHDLRLPRHATRVSYLEDDGWSSHGMFLTFRLPRKDVPGFLRKNRIPEEELRPGFHVTEAERVGWRARPGRKYRSGASSGVSGTPVPPTYRVGLDVTDPSWTTVYLVSVTD
ncbi:hypothetical protein [Streptomyces sp. NPDC005438]|uniref:hypothetical protein n=1 Tax=Streptomyces sp. NPDC005438 TaxID=3156880 RepID=UPI0033AB0A8C